MMGIRDYLVSVIDLLLVAFLLLFLGLMAVKFDESKGIKDLDYIAITPLEASDEIDGDWNAYTFNALVLKNEKIALRHYDRGSDTLIKIYPSYSAFEETADLDINQTYVIFELGTSDNLANVTRYLARRSIPIGLASVSPD